MSRFISIADQLAFYLRIDLNQSMIKPTFPNALVLLILFILVAGLMSYIVPAGQYDRIYDNNLEREVIVPGSFQTVPSSPVSIGRIFMAVPEGFIGAVEIMAIIVFGGGAFYVIDKTGALKEGIASLAHKIKGKEEVGLVLVALIFSILGALNGFHEEIIALTPMLLIFTRRIGFDSFVTLGISLGAATIGSTFSPISPFSVGLAQNLAELPLLSGGLFRLVFWVIAFSVWLFMIIQYGRKNKVEVQEQHNEEGIELHWRSRLILFLTLMAFIVMIYGMLYKDWGFNEITADFFVLGVVCGIVGKLGFNGTAEGFSEGFREMVFAAVVVGLARGISSVLSEGLIMDTITHALFTPLQYLPVSFFAIGMMISHAVLLIPVPSTTGQAVLTIPIVAPLSDLIGLSRQVCVLTYQYGGVVMDIIVPTNGALMAILLILKIPYDDWFRFIYKKVLVMLALGAVAIIIAIAIDLQ